MLILLLVIYVVGFVLLIAAALWASGRENTDHGRIVVVQIGFAIAIQWPLALVYFACVGVVLLVRRSFRAARESLR